jgi:two-component system response regulator
MVIEDQAGDVLMIRQALAGERIPVSIHVAVDGKQAVDMLAGRHFDPDLILLDLKLPKLDGLSFLARSRPSVPVVVFTSSDRPADIQRSFELGAKDFIPKPLDAEEYFQVVSYIVRRWVVATRSEDCIRRDD